MSTHSQKSVKRKRTAHACDVCRQRKSRCNGARPICDVCLGMGFECSYRDPFKRRSNSGSTSVDIEDRIEKLERLLRENTNKSPMSHPHDVEKACSPKPGIPPLSNDSVDGMCAITFAGEYSPEYFGPTSSSGLFNSIVYAMKTIDCGGLLTSKLAGPTTKTSQMISRPPSPASMAEKSGLEPAKIVDEDLYTLPPWEEAFQLVNIFFSNTGRLFPYLCKTTILGFVNTLYQKDRLDHDDRLPLCLVNMVMGFATIHSPTLLSTLEKLSQGEGFFRRSLSLVSTIRNTDATLESVQALLLLAQYVQGTQRSAQTWSFVSAAVQGGFQIGLYRSPASDVQNVSQLEAEMRKRTWWMCFMMDRMCSMTFGRPPLIPNHYMTVDLPLDCDLETLASQLKPAPHRVAPGAGLFLHTSRLNMILGQIIDSLYHNNLKDNTSDTLFSHLQVIIETDHHLEEWTKGLPRDLTILNTSNLPNLTFDDASGPERFSVVLSLRYLNVKSLLHRTVLDRLLRLPSPNADVCSMGYLQSVVRCSLDACVYAARDTINIISKTAHHQIFLPIWWYSVYYLLNSSLILFGNMLLLLRTSAITPTHCMTELIGTLKTAYETLDYFGTGTRLVVRCHKVLERLLYIAQLIDTNPDAGDSLKGKTSDVLVSGNLSAQMTGPTEQPVQGGFLFSPVSYQELPLETDFGVSFDEIFFPNDSLFPQDM